MARLTEDRKAIVTWELMRHVTTLKLLQSDTPGMPGQALLCAPNKIYTLLEAP